ncbi:heme-degrading monooxygenase HmoA [Thermosporothrix hazakensis]|jgi:heme-degrading monooxygenase HmoA|uniref:Heme-degrading monooxygenase HmoA n=1 Tax=Thermosporothrix hazakensis TaxID=644383 RepID=A0A326TR42_THEHA|nr:antibiotic biosynthesis monooxygenase family protein [Thermosporothrix hazakensis]PZW18306.1 heme-degrading monooxygenase HmoA [Thermosporothrix hazakensis]GCE51432.1 antibiotic biosynthesis monooxygenase [Thermosporothrix hazakensis]
MSRQTGEPIVVINVFTVQPEKQQEFLRLALDYTNQFVSKAPGFLSATFYTSLDGTKITSVARWESEEAFLAFSAPSEDNDIEATREKGEQTFLHLDSNTYRVAARFLSEGE